MKIPLLAALIVGLAPCAAAQVTCAEIKTITAAAEDDFTAFEGEEIDDDLYKSTYSLPGAQDCTLDYEYDSIFSCMFTYDNLASAQSAMNAHAASVAACLPTWSAKALTPDPPPATGTRALQGTFYAGPGAQDDLEWGVFLEEHTFDGGKDWHVTVGLAWLL